MSLFDRLFGARSWQFLRFYQAAIINTVFGFTLYALLVHLGLNRYVAQITSHLMGMCFNYVTYSRHVFRNKGSKVRFALSYLLSGVLNFILLYLISFIISSPYYAGLAATFGVSLVMYAVLKFGVFERSRNHA